MKFPISYLYYNSFQCVTFWLDNCVWSSVDEGQSNNSATIQNDYTKKWLSKQAQETFPAVMSYKDISDIITSWADWYKNYTPCFVLYIQSWASSINFKLWLPTSKLEPQLQNLTSHLIFKLYFTPKLQMPNSKIQFKVSIKC